MSNPVPSNSTAGAARRRSDAAPLLVASDIHKSYAGVPVLHSVSLTVHEGTIHGLLGKNGAGKSTLANVIAGLADPDGGSLHLDGLDITALSMKERKHLGLHMLSQHSEIFPDLSVAENLLLPEMPLRFGLTNWARANRIATGLLERYGAEIPAATRAGDLNLGHRRRLAIIKALVGQARLIILDEPTAGLAARDRQHLIQWVEDLTAAGTAFIYISHHNDEVRKLCREYTVLRDGRLEATGDASDLTAERMARLVTGADIDEFRRQKGHATGKPVLSVHNLEFAECGPVDLVVHPGEVIGLTGLLGEGPQELLRALAGLAPIRGGSIVVGEKPARITSPKSGLKHGLAYLTHDRIGEGLVGIMSIINNLSLGDWPIGPFGLVNPGAMARRVREARAAMDIKMGAATQEVRQLSGGNQQKILLGRLLSRGPRILLLDEPTVGVDIAAKEHIHKLIDQATKNGIAVLLLAQDPDEMERLADRVILFSRGRAIREIAGEALTVDALAGTRPDARSLP